MKQSVVCPLISSILLSVLLLSACAESDPRKNDRPPSQADAVATKPDSGASETDAQTQAKAMPPEPQAEFAEDLISAVVPSPQAPSPSEPMRARAIQHLAQKQIQDVQVSPPQIEPNRERYGKISDNPVKVVAEEPVSTFSVDVDTGSYANVRRMLTNGQLPPPDAVRVEEMINYFPYHYALPKDDKPFAVHTALAPAPWNANRVLLRVALKGQDIAKQTLPPVNLVFLVDVSGSMHSQDKLPLLQASLKLLARQLRKQDKVSLVTYAGSTAVVLSGASGGEKEKIIGAIDRLRAGGSTAGAAGIELAYQQARENFIQDGINRILLATDGDFNVGVTDFDQLKRMIEEKRKSGVSFTTLGFGTGNYNEHMMEQLADAGNGAYSYIDSLMEGEKVLVNEMTSTLATIAKDVKIQIEFNPEWVREYRLIGYENRMLRREDFNNDKVDAGDIGAGHTVTALYELTLAGDKGAIEPLRYRQEKTAPAASGKEKKNELAFIKLRYKKPDGEQSTLIEYPVPRTALQPFKDVDDDFRLATAVAGFGQLLRGTANLGSWRFEDARALAADFSASRESKAGGDPYGYRAELVRLIKLADALAASRAAPGQKEE
jgi:Ca-activated chloride channel family protein